MISNADGHTQEPSRDSGLLALACGRLVGRRLSESLSFGALEPERTPPKGPETHVTAVVVTHKRPRQVIS